MKRTAIIVTLVLSSSAWLLAQGPAKVEDEIKKLEEQLRQAAVKADTAVLGRRLYEHQRRRAGALQGPDHRGREAAGRLAGGRAAVDEDRGVTPGL